MMKVLFFLVALSHFSHVGCAISAQPIHAAPGERGNWVKKRAWIKESQVTNEQIQKDAQAAKKARGQFYPEFEKVDKKINDFYSTKGFVRGKMGTLVAELKADAQKEKERRIESARKKSESDDAPLNFYDVQIEAIEQDVKRLERDFEQFNLDMKSIADLDASLTERLKIVDKQIGDANDVAGQSAKKLSDMWWMIDDQKACDAYYVIQGFSEKVAAIKKYLDETLFSDFKSVIATLEKQLEQVAKQIETLEQRGLVVAHRTLRLSKKEKPDVLNVVAEEAIADEEIAQPRRRKLEKKENSWVDFIGNALWAPVGWVLSFWQGAAAPVKLVRSRRRNPVKELNDESVVEPEQIAEAKPEAHGLESKNEAK